MHQYKACGYDQATNKLEFIVDARTRLRAPTDGDAAPLFAIIDANRAHLRRWLPWVDAVTEPSDTANFLRGVNERAALGTSLDLLIEHVGEFAGVAGYRALDPLNQSGEIGYWLRADFGGRGITTACCRALVAHGFERLGLNRIAIAAATGNAKSRAVYSLLRSER